MPRCRRQLPLRYPQILLPLPLLACAHRHALILRTTAVDHTILFLQESRLAPRAARGGGVLTDRRRPGGPSHSVPLPMPASVTLLCDVGHFSPVHSSPYNCEVSSIDHGGV